MAGLLGCGPQLLAPNLVAQGREAPAGAPASPGLGSTPATASRLVVSLVIDQLPSWALERYAPLFDEGSALREAMTHGAYYAQGQYDYAGTYTAPGHATLYTGVLPREHGVGANEVWDAARGRTVSVVDDGQHAVVGSADQFASPVVLRVPTVADELEQETNGRAVTVSLSLKDRAAVLPGGQHADLALFYDAKRGEFSTSVFYAGGLPNWLVSFQRAHPLSARLDAWQPGNASALERLLGPDAAPGEGDWLGMGASFPHDPRRSPEPLTAVRVTPTATEYLFDVARECAARLELGQDDVPDLLMISVSSVDYAGHVFGPESWEYADSLVRTDRALTRFLSDLRPRGPVSVLVTSDHGVAPLPEQSARRGHLAFRVPPKKVAQAANLALAGRFGLKGPPIASYTEPFVYLSPEAKGSPAYREILDAVAGELGKTPGVAATYSVRELVARPPESELAALVRASVPDDCVADLFVVPSEYSVVDPAQPGGSGTSHGSPWTYDRHVPVLFWGPGVSARFEPEPVSILRVAPTLSALLGIHAPASAQAAPLPGAPER